LGYLGWVVGKVRLVKNRISQVRLGLVGSCWAGMRLGWGSLGSVVERSGLIRLG
jgi:hypothetical protein